MLLEKGVCYDQCILLAKLCQALPCFIVFLKTKEEKIKAKKKRINPFECRVPKKSKER